MINDEFEKNIREEATKLGVASYVIYSLLESEIIKEPKKLLKVERHNDEVIYIAYTAKDDNKYITAYDERSYSKYLRTKTIKVLPYLPDSMSLKNKFFATLEMGGVEDKLFAIINNPDDKAIDYGGFSPSLEEVLNLSKTVTLPDDILKHTISQIMCYRGITIITSIYTYGTKIGRVYFIKGDTIKSIDIIGSRYINLNYLMNETDLIMELFKEVPECRYIQLLESVLYGYDREIIKIYRDNGLKLRFVNYSGCDTCYFIGNDYITAYEPKIGIKEIKIHIPDHIRNSNCDKAHSILEAIESKNNRDSEYFVLSIEDLK